MSEHTALLVNCGKTIWIAGSMTELSAKEAVERFNKVASNHDRLTREVAELKKALHSIYRRAELAEADGVHMRGALGNIREEANEALAKVTP